MSGDFPLFHRLSLHSKRSITFNWGPKSTILVSSSVINVESGGGGGGKTEDLQMNNEYGTLQVNYQKGKSICNVFKQNESELTNIDPVL